ncbi:hypothetical protein Tco_0105272 [Tanacetum coccineum]
MHNEDQQATGGPTSLGVASEEGAHPQLNSGCDASADSTTKTDPGISAHNDSLPPQQGKVKGTKNYSLDHIFAGTDPNVLADKTKSVSDGLETVLTTPKTRTIDFKDMDLLEDDPIIVVDEREDEEEDKDEGIHSSSHVETKDTSASKPPSPRSIEIQKLKNQVLALQSQKHKLEQLKDKAEAEVAFLTAQPSFPNVEQLNELLELPSKFHEITKEVKGLKKQVHELELELPEELKEIPTKLEDFAKTVTGLISQVAELKTLQWELPEEFCSLPIQVVYVQAKLKTLDALPTGDAGVPSAGHDNTMPVEGEKNTNQATISQLFQRRAEKDAENENLNKQQPKPTTPLTTPIIPPIITTTT